MTIQELVPFFIDDASPGLITSAQYLRRIDSYAGRWYYDMVGNEPVFYLSGTSFIKSVLPDNKFLTDWKVSIVETLGSREEMDEYVEETANYGTIMHMAIGKMAKEKKFDYREQFEYITELLHDTRVDQKNLIQQRRHLLRDVVAFAQWCHDYNVKVLAIEYAITDLVDPVATCIDLVAEIDIEVEAYMGDTYASGPKKGLPKATKDKKRIVAVIDLKSGRKGFYDAHKMQLAMNMRMWNQRFKDTPYEAEAIYNWAPSDWQGMVPTYKFADQTGNKFVQTLDKAMEWAKILNSRLFIPTFTEVVGGEFQLGEFPVISKENIYTIVKNYELNKDKTEITDEGKSESDLEF